MRRTATILALLTLFVGAPAGAHPLVQQPKVPVGKVATVTLTVISEAATPMVAADIELPASFTLERVAPGSGWSADIDGATVRTAGPPIALGSAIFVSLTGTFATRGPVPFPVTTRAEDGTTARWGGPPEGPLPAAVVYAGVDPPGPPGSGENGRPWLAIAGGALVLTGVVLFVIDRRRRRPAEPDLDDAPLVRQG
jgi:hypothetical protein